jgi:hypothetical protein
MEKELPQFLRNLADRIESNTLSEEDLRKVSEFYMSHLFRDKIGNTSQDDYMKFLVLGWYVYNQTEKLTEASV